MGGNGEGAVREGTGSPFSSLQSPAKVQTKSPQVLQDSARHRQGELKHRHGHPCGHTASVQQLCGYPQTLYPRGLVFSPWPKSLVWGAKNQQQGSIQGGGKS